MGLAIVGQEQHGLKRDGLKRDGREQDGRVGHEQNGRERHRLGESEEASLLSYRIDKGKHNEMPRKARLPLL